VRIWTISGSPSLISVAQPLTDCAAASSSAVWLAPFVNDGVSLIAVTLIVKVWLSLVSSPPFKVPPLSLRDTVTVAIPFALAAGV